ncbi:hypothetical protein N7535_001669 [Penicillium sp. DV-2018c]|nr:hypothetical protein N7535_001669 [Penicillium sp. DV-2018c]
MIAAELSAGSRPNIHIRHADLTDYASLKRAAADSLTRPRSLPTQLTCPSWTPLYPSAHCRSTFLSAIVRPDLELTLVPMVLIGATSPRRSRPFQRD